MYLLLLFSFIFFCWLYRSIQVYASFETLTMVLKRHVQPLQEGGRRRSNKLFVSCYKQNTLKRRGKKDKIKYGVKAKFEILSSPSKTL